MSKMDKRENIIMVNMLEFHESETDIYRLRRLRVNH